MDAVDIEQLVEQMQAEVAQRRANGSYPPGLEAQLEAEFETIMAAVHRGELNTSELGRRVKSVEHSLGALGGDISLSSKVPGGASVHRAAGRVVGRHTSPLADQVRNLGTDIARALHEVHHLIEVQKAADERQLNDVVAALFDRVAILDHVADAMVNLERRVAELERGAAR